MRYFLEINATPDIGIAERKRIVPGIRHHLDESVGGEQAGIARRQGKEVLVIGGEGNCQRWGDNTSPNVCSVVLQQHSGVTTSHGEIQGGSGISEVPVDIDVCGRRQAPVIGMAPAESQAIGCSEGTVVRTRPGQIESGTGNPKIRLIKKHAPVDNIYRLYGCTFIPARCC